MVTAERNKSRRFKGWLNLHRKVTIVYMADIFSNFDISADNILVVAGAVGVAVVLFTSAVRFAFRAAIVAAIVLGGWLYSENPDKFKEQVTTEGSGVVSTATDTAIEALPEESQEKARALLGNATASVKEMISDENINTLFERIEGGLGGLQELAGEYESTKGVLPTEITPIFPAD